MGIFVKLFIGFAIFFIGVVLNVRIMKKFEGGKTEGPFPMLSFILICAGMIILVVMASTIPVDVESTGEGVSDSIPGFGTWR